MDCVTPSNPLGLEKGYGIEKGKAFSIYEKEIISNFAYTSFYILFTQ